MKNNKKNLIWLLSILLGSAWTYSLLTRLELFFLIPLWLKLIFLIGLAFSAILLAYFLITNFIHWAQKERSKYWFLLAALIVTGLIFLLAPYHHVPFRTTHQLQLKANETEVELIGIFSPDDNLIYTEELEIEGETETYSETGLRLSPHAQISYQRAFTGGLTLSFTPTSGPVSLEWDGTQQTIAPATLASGEFKLVEGWRAFYDTETESVNVRLPGNTWGNPDRFWSILGAFLPIADYISLSSIALGVIWLVIQLVAQQGKIKLSWGLLKAWGYALLVLLILKWAIDNQVPDANSWFALLFFIPMAGGLALYQINFLIEKSLIKSSWLEKLLPFTQKLFSKAAAINRSKWLFWILITLIAIVGVISLYRITDPGMGISGDSVHYMDGAKNLATGLGYVRTIEFGEPQPITGFPPGFPLLLFLGIKLGIDVETTARILNIILFFIYILLLGGIIFHFTKKVLPGVLAGAFSVMSIPLLSIFSWVMSEPLFITLMLLIIIVWYWHLNKPSNWKLLLLGLLSGYLALVRLAGLSLVAAIALSLILNREGKPLKRWAKAIGYGVVAVLPTLLFLYRNSKVADTISESRGLNFAVFQPEYWQIILREAASWFKLSFFFYEKEALQITIFLILFGLVIGFYIFFKAKESKKGRPGQFTINDLMVLFIIVYVIMIVLNVVIFTPQQTISGLTRYTIPLFPILLFVIIMLISGEVWPKKALLPKILIMAMVLILFRVYWAEDITFLKHQPTHFRAYTDIILDCKEDLGRVTNLPENSEIYSNNCEFIYYATGMQCHHLLFDPEAYQEDGEIYDAIQQGNILAWMLDYGSTPPGVEDLVIKLDNYDYGCMINFYEWPAEAQ